MKKTLVPISESIKFQISKKDIDFIESVANNFDLLIADFQEKPGKGFMKRPSTKIRFAEIDKLISERFGFRIKHIHGEGVLYANIPIPPKGINVLMNDVDENFKNIDKYIKDNPELQDGKGLEMEEIEDFKDLQSIFKNVKSSYRALNRKLDMEKITVDFDKAVIKGLPSNFHIYAIIDFVQMCAYVETGISFVAVLLHEIGHMFSSIAEAGRQTKVIGSLMDALHEVETNDYTKPEVIELMNRKVFGKDLINNDAGPDEIVRKTQQYVLGLNNGSDNMYSVEAEHEADIFAARFGLGVYLSEFLNQIDTEEKKYAGYFWSQYLTTTFSIAMTSVLFLGIYLSVAVMFGMLFFGILFTIGLTIIPKLIFGGEKQAEKVYDIAIRRNRRLIEQNIRLLRTHGLSDDVKSEIVKNIRQMRLVEQKLDNPHFFARIERMTDNIGSNAEKVDDNRRAETNIDNPLHELHQEWRLK